MKENHIAPQVQELMTKLKKSIDDIMADLGKANLFPERKEEILGEVEKATFVMEILFGENNLAELEKSHTYIESLRLNIPNWENIA